MAAAFTGFLERVVDADVHSLTVHLAGTFTPTEEMGADARLANELMTKLVKQAHRNGKLRPDVVVGDIELLLEGCAAIRVPDAGRTSALRQRYLRLCLTGLSSDGKPPLPGPPPSQEELAWRWTQR